MSKTLESNLIIRAKLPAPEGKGLDSVYTSLQGIDRLITKINRRVVNVKVKYSGDKDVLGSLDSVLSSIEKRTRRASKQAAAAATAAAQQPGTGFTLVPPKQIGHTPSKGGPISTLPRGIALPGGANRQGRGPGGGGSGGGGRGGRGGSGGAGFFGAGEAFQETIRIVPGEDGDNVTRQTRHGFTEGQQQTKTTVNRDEATGNILSAEQVTDQLDQITKLKHERKRAVSEQEANEAAALRRQQIRRNAAAGEQHRLDLEAEGFSSRSKIQTEVLPNGQQADTVLTEHFKVLADGSETVRTYNEAVGQLGPEKINKNTDAYRAQTKALKEQEAATKRAADQAKAISDERARLTANAAKGGRLAGRFTAAGATELPVERTTAPLKSDATQAAQTSVRQFSQVLADGSERVYRYDEATDRLTSRLNRNTQAYRDTSRAANQVQAETRANAQAADLAARGFTVYGEKLRTVSMNGRDVVTAQTEMRRVTGSALTGSLAIEITKLNSATGVMETKTIRGADAVRALGDSFTGAIRKIGMWFAATGSIFAFTRAVGFLGGEMKELQANTVFMARVGGALGASFRTRHAEAKLLTSGIIEQSKALGVSATESQQASTVFLRAGQGRLQALESTRVAMIAARIAEIDVGEAAKLVSAAQAQFNLESGKLIGTLDILNSLSNKYRVSTDDLLQSISRGGSVYAEAGGSLEELAALTAVTAERTARSGAEIGNAVKTIQSRLASPEVVSALLEKTGVSTRNTDGSAKSYVKTLLQLQTALGLATAAERSSIPVKIAGARQVNILNTQLKSVVDVVIAEARALRDGASAEKEAAESAGTLEASLMRLQAQFVAVGENAETATSSMLAGLIASVNGLLTMANAYDGIIIKVGVFIVAMMVVRSVLVRITAAAAGATGSMVALTAAELAAASAATLAARAFQRMQAAMGPIGWAALVITLALTALIDVMGELDAASAAKSILDKKGDEAGRQATAIENRRKATMQLIDALSEQLAAQRRINELEKEGKPVDPKYKQSVKENIARLTGKTGLNIPGFEGGADTEEKMKALEGEYYKKALADNEALLKSRKTEYEASVKGEADKQKAIDETSAALEKERAKYQELVDFKNEFERRKAEWMEGKNVLSNMNYMLNNGERYDKVRDEFEKGSADDSFRDAEHNNDAAISGMEEQRAKSENLRVEMEKLATVKIPSPLDDTFRNAVSSGKEAIAMLNRFRSTNDVKSKTGTDIEALRVKDLKDNVTLLTEAQAKAAASLAALKDQTDTADYDKFKKSIIDITEALADLEMKQREVKIKNAGEYFSRQIESRVPLAMAGALQNAELADIRADGSTNGGEKFAGVRSQRRQIEAMKSAARARQWDASAIVTGTTAPAEEKLAASQALQAKAAELIGKARELEYKTAMDILAIEREIVAERKKQNEETLKALGLLGDEEKIQVLQQAEYFRKNPGKMVTAEEQFLASADTNKINQDFFGDKLQNDFDPRNAFDKSLLDAGIGPQNRDLTNAEAELNRLYTAAGGRNKVLEETNKRGEDLLNIQTNMEGKDVPFLNIKASIDTIHLDVNNFVDPKMMQPLVDEFRTATTTELIKVRDEMIKEVSKIWTTVRNIPGFDATGSIPETAP